MPDQSAVTPAVPARRVLLVNASEHVFGAEHSVAGLAAAVQDDHWQFMVACPSGAASEFFTSSGMQVCELPLWRFSKTTSPAHMLRQIVRWIRGNWLLHRLCRRMLPDVIHANGIQSMLYVPLAAYLLHIPVAWHVRDLNSPKRLVRFCGSLAQAIFAPSEAVLQSLGTLREKVQVIPNPVRLSAILPRVEAAVPAQHKTLETLADAQGFKIGLVGQMIPRKGHDILLRAAPAILERVPDARIFFVGGDPFDPNSCYVQHLRRQVEASPSLRARVFFLEYVPLAQAVYSLLSVLVVPSRSEAFGRVAIEAMACGCPVIASNTGGLAEIVRDRQNGLLFNAENADGLAECVVELATDAELRCRLVGLGYAAASEYENRLPSVVAATRKVYAKLAGASTVPANGKGSS